MTSAVTTNSVSVVVEDNGYLSVFSFPAFIAPELNQWDYLTMVAGLLVAGVCVCRLNALRRKLHRKAVQTEYLSMFVGSVVLAFSPWLFPEDRTIGDLFFAVCSLASMLLSTPLWRKGPPESAESRPAPLTLTQDLFHEHPQRRTLGRRLQRLWRRVLRRLAVGADVPGDYR